MCPPPAGSGSFLMYLSVRTAVLQTPDARELKNGGEVTNETGAAGASRRRFLIRGRVQGVGFRAWTQRRARELGLRGWVRNLADGSVDVCAQGDARALERLYELLRKGPPLARVREVRELSPDEVDLPPAFAIE